MLDTSSQIAYVKDDLLQKTAGGGLLQIPPFKDSATQVCADYLREIYKYTISILEKRITPEVLEVTPLEFWFTVPAIWSDKAKSVTYEAAERAGFGSRPNDSANMIPEPEAAAVATLSKPEDDSQWYGLNVGDGILVCDCGGGTVDIVTYNITDVRPHLEFEELLIGTGAKCGSTFIDREFYRWMYEEFGSAFEKVNREKKGQGSRFIRDFESCKRDFGWPGNSNTFEVELVMSTAKDSPHYDVDNSTIIFTM